MTAVLTLKGNANYSAVLTTYYEDREKPLEGLDRLVGYEIFGMQALVGKGQFQDGDAIIAFFHGSQIDKEFASAHNLYRHANLNKDPEATGYLDDNARIKALKLRGNRSEALIMQADTLDVLCLEWRDDFAHVTSRTIQFDTVNGKPLVWKHVVKQPREQSGTPRTSLNHLVDLPEHPETGMLFRNLDKLRDGDTVNVSQKLHGTSVRAAMLPMSRPLKWWERLAKKLGVRVTETEYQLAVGSRRVVKSLNGEEKPGEHYYSTDIYTATIRNALRHGSQLPHNFLIYGEIVGFEPGEPLKPIQKDFEYDAIPGTADLYLYRVQYRDDNGILYELTRKQVEVFAERYGWRVVPGLFEGVWHGGDRAIMIPDNYGSAAVIKIEDMLDVRFNQSGLSQALPLSHPTLPDEGVVLRVETGGLPLLLKAKSPQFYEHEGVMTDQGLGDIEDNA